MVKRAKGFNVRWRKGKAFVRITHAGVRSEHALGATNSREANEEARKRYAEIISGREVVTASRTPLIDLVTKWLEARKPTLKRSTLNLYETEMVGVVFHFKTLEKMTEESLNNYADTLLHTRLASSVRVRFRVLRSFLTWCKTRGILAHTIHVPQVSLSARGTPSSRQKQRHITPMSEADIEKILAAMPERTHRGNPCRARFRFQYETSLRPATISKLETPKHYVRGSGRLTITADIDKTGYARTVRLSAAAIEAIDSVCPDVGRIFGTIAAYQIFRRAVKAAGLSKEIADNASQYDLRHSRITNWLDATGNLTGTAQLAGHTQLTTTSRYTRQNEETGARVITGAETGAVHKSGKKAR